MVVLGLFFAATRFGLRGYFYMIRVRKSESPSASRGRRCEFLLGSFRLEKMTVFLLELVDVYYCLPTALRLV